MTRDAIDEARIDACLYAWHDLSADDQVAVDSFCIALDTRGRLTEDESWQLAQLARRYL